MFAYLHYQRSVYSVPLMPRLRILVSIALTASLAGSACGGSGDDTLIVYSGRSLELVGTLIEQFEAETGLEVEVREGDSTELAATLLLEGDNSPADVFLAQDPASLGTAAEMLDQLPADLLSLVPDRFSDTDGRWVGISGRARTLVYNADLVDEADLPSSIDDLTDPRWAGRLGIAPTNSSFQAFVAAMILTKGEEATLAWLEAIAANNPVDYPKNSPIVAATDAGEVDAGLVNHYYLFRLIAEQGESTATNYFLPAGDAGSLVMPSGAGILAGSDSKDAARQFIEFMLSRSAQEHFASETFEYPLVPGIAADARLPAIESISTPDINLSDLAGALDRATDLIAEAGLL